MSEIKLPEVTPYVHKIQYYENDRMGITHHARYVYWLEEARMDWLMKLGWGYDRLEAAGVNAPVLGVACTYKAATAFPGKVTIKTYMKKIKGLRYWIGYEVTRDDGRLALLGETEHCFVNREGRPVRLSKVLPEFDDLLTQLAASRSV